MEPKITITLRAIYRRRMLVWVVMFGAVMLLAQTVNAQRPSIADLQSQINALNNQLDPPAAQVRTALDLLPTFQDAVARSRVSSRRSPAARMT